MSQREKEQDLASDSNVEVREKEKNDTIILSG